MVKEFYWMSNKAQAVSFNEKYEFKLESEYDVVFDTGTSVSYVP